MTGKNRFDFIIVGAGSAGCALARRLSDNPDVKVLLIEAGGPDSRPDIHDPGKYFGLWGSEVDWGYTTIPQRATAYRVHKWPRGKVLGGTSSINGMVYLRGAREDYDYWAYQGNVGWDYASVLRSFKEMETCPEADPRYHGRSGPLHPAIVGDPNPISEAFIEGCVELGYPRNADFNGEHLEGAGWNQCTIYQGKRESSARAFLLPVMDRPNLTVMTETFVYQLALDKSLTTTGVRYVRAGTLGEAEVDREVILSGGAVDSPKLLLLSGLGPAAELEQVGIDVVLDLPEIGKNLVDHMLIGVVYEASRPIPPEYAFVCESCLFAKSDSLRLSPDIEISFVKERNFAEGFLAPDGCFTIIPGIVKPQSRGWLRLRSANPVDPPIINPRHMEEEADVRGLLNGIEMSRAVGQTKALKDWTRGEVVPSAAGRDEQGLRRYIARSASTWFHPVGTCRMGIRGDAVVDPQLRVRGVAGLRVADASVMPEIVSSNTNAASMMIGWKAGEIILEHQKPVAHRGLQSAQRVALR